MRWRSEKEERTETLNSTRLRRYLISKSTLLLLYTDQSGERREGNGVSYNESAECISFPREIQSDKSGT